MKTLEILKNRRTYYNINKTLPVKEEMLIDFIKEATELVPDAFNMKSQRLNIFTGKRHVEAMVLISK